MTAIITSPTSRWGCWMVGVVIMIIFMDFASIRYTAHLQVPINLPLGKKNHSSHVQQTSGLSPVQQEKDGDSQSSSTQLAWLLSYPNSGTSYTLNNMVQMTKQSTATNYGRGWSQVYSAVSGDQISPQDRENAGPYYMGNNPLPPTFVLTKTHCGGYCDSCVPSEFVLPTADDFERKCRRSERDFVSASTNKTSSLQLAYKTHIPKAIHLIRHPLDNIVSRMHLSLKKVRPPTGRLPKKLPGRIGSWLNSIADLPTKREQLVEWCKMTDALQAKKWDSSQLVTSDIKRKVQQAPLCGLELFRYVQWHMRALEMTTAHHHDMKTHILYYESYSTNYNATVQGLLDFLELKDTGDREPFHGNKTYFDTLFTPQERHESAELIRFLASGSAVLPLLEHYLTAAHGME
mmetsp:Transcript_39696/g.82500  ORF Transcript_39696/g.82500 Transcript_39696/m.82500 type:complete len:404 (-) Transcript_39696:685-1896(-)